MDWLSAAEALALLGTQPQTLYANVSRGRIKARPDPDDNRRSLYRGDDVRRLAHRAAGRRKQATVAAQAMHLGEPVLPSSVSTVQDGRLLYRGRDAALLAETATLEEIAALLWQAPVVLPPIDLPAPDIGLEAAFVALARRAASLRPVMARSPPLLAHEAARILAIMAHALAGPAGSSQALHLRLAGHWHRPEAADAIRRALVLLADHELNASAFAARVTVSTGASLWAGALSGLATLSGPRHGLASREVGALARDIGASAERAEPALRDWLDEGRAVPGFGHPLYPAGDPRCIALLRAFDLLPAFAAYRQAGESLTADAANIDFALAALAASHELPADAGLTLFALSRTVGWLAHMIEQIGSGQSIRPRARYTGQYAFTSPTGERSTRSGG